MERSEICSKKTFLHDAHSMGFASIPDAVQEFAQGHFIILLDSASRENEGDLIIAASALTPEKAAFMIRHTSGFLCAPITSALTTHLELPQMVASNQDPQSTAYTISIDIDDPRSTGISARERSRTCQMLADSDSVSSSFRRPGHVLPLRAREGGVRERAGHTEATIEFCRLAGRELVGVLAELVEASEDVDGNAEIQATGMMSTEGCLAFGRRFGITVVRIEDLIGFLERVEGGRER